MQWNQNASTPSVNVVYPQTQNVISSSSYPSATYSFTADFRTPNQSDPLITATSTFKPLLQNPQKPNPNYSIFQQKPNFSNQKSLGQSLKRSPAKLYAQETQKEHNIGTGYILNHQGQMHPQEYGYTSCNVSGKIPVRKDIKFIRSFFVVAFSYLFLEPTLLIGTVAMRSLLWLNELLRL